MSRVSRATESKKWGKEVKADLEGQSSQSIQMEIPQSKHTEKYQNRNERNKVRRVSNAGQRKGRSSEGETHLHPKKTSRFHGMSSNGGIHGTN